MLLAQQTHTDITWKTLEQNISNSHYLILLHCLVQFLFDSRTRNSYRQFQDKSKKKHFLRAWPDSLHWFVKFLSDPRTTNTYWLSRKTIKLNIYYGYYMKIIDWLILIPHRHAQQIHTDLTRTRVKRNISYIHYLTNLYWLVTIFSVSHTTNTYRLYHENRW